MNAPLQGGKQDAVLWRLQQRGTASAKEYSRLAIELSLGRSTIWGMYGVAEPRGDRLDCLRHPLRRAGSKRISGPTDHKVQAQVLTMLAPGEGASGALVAGSTD
jgi:hypothetical protein